MTDWQLTREEQLLCDCVQSSRPDLAHRSACELVQRLGADRAFEFANRNEVTSHVAHALGADANEAFRAAHEDVSERIGHYMRELDRVANRLDENGIPLVALKNSGIARGIYPCLGCSPMGDLDVMVRRSDFRRAHQILIKDGFEFRFRSSLEDSNFDAAEKSGGSEYLRQLPTGEQLWFELQWRPVSGRWIQPHQEPDSEVLMDESVSIDGSCVRLLSPTDNLLQVALHTAKHTYVRAPGFRLHTDVDRIVTHSEVDWGRFSSGVQAAGLTTAVYFSLKLARDLLGTPIPGGVFEKLQPASWKERLLARWIRRAGLLNPHQKKFGRIQYVAFVSLLYDDLGSFSAAVIPNAEWMMEQYGGHGPRAHAKRLLGLLLRRENT